MRFSTTALLLAFAFTLSAQTTYKLTYADTLTVRLPASVLNNMTLSISGNLPDSLKKQVDSALRKQFSMKPLVQLQERKVTATADSTIVEIDQSKVVGNGVRVPLAYHRMVMKGGKITGVFASDRTSMDLPPDEDRRFLATGGKQIILNYECAAYKSGLVTIWVTRALPSSINPGIKNVDIPGAILGFELESGMSTMISKVQLIQPAN